MSKRTETGAPAAEAAGHHDRNGSYTWWLMVWSAAETLSLGLTTGKQVVWCPAATPVARLGERRAAPPGTRLTADFASSKRRNGGDDKI